MSRPRKPNALKLLQGETRPHRHRPEADWPVVEGYPQGPDWLCNDDARAEWDRAVKWLQDTTVLTEPDLNRLAWFCNLHGKGVEKWRAGEMPSSRDTTDYRIMAGEFGFTPASRHKATPAGKPKSTNAFAKLTAE